MKIGNRLVDSSQPPLVIAEIGINHGGSLDTARRMADLAAQSGAECVKHQTHFPDDEMTSEAKGIRPPNASQSIWDVIESAALTPDEEIRLKEHVESLGMIYISTPFSRKAADFLNTIQVPAFKIGSGEADNLPLIRHIANFGKPIILSTGMQTIESLQKSVAILNSACIEYALLECTNLYPSPPEIVSLKGISELKESFPKAQVGFSDHSMGPSMAIAAVALGATILERHFTDTRYRVGPDISCSMDPAELRFLIDRSKEIHKALHNSKSRSTEEEAVYRFARGSVVADRDLCAGECIDESSIWTRRPGTGQIPAYEFDKIIGAKLIKDVKKNQQLRWSDITLNEHEA
jgi:N-acetylneuraminate synthase